VIHNVTPEPDLWRFVGPDGPINVRVSGPLIANNTASIGIAVRSGLGIALLPEIQAIDDLRAGRLYRLLSDYPSQLVPVQIVYPSRRNLAPRTRVVMDFLIEQMRGIASLLEAGAEVLT
jgi:DNA-binding transcriptional LysR family regulator